MEKTWFEIRIRIPATGADLVSYELMELGCEGVTVEERELDTFILPDPDEVSSETFEIKAYFPAIEDLEAFRLQVRERLDWLSTLIPGLEAVLPEVRPVTNADWAEGWKQHFSAVRIGKRLVVKPSWETFETTDQDVVMVLDPGMAFGTGTHGTTRLCLEAVAREFDGPKPPARVLDVGTGSGILALAAALLGAQRVLGCDIDEQSCETARENAELNGMGHLVEITGESLEALEGGFDLVLANILAEENTRLASELVSRVAPGGTLVLSGILHEKESLVTRAFEGFGLSGPELTRLEDWSCLVYRKER